MLFRIPALAFVLATCLAWAQEPPPVPAAPVPPEPPKPSYRYEGKPIVLQVKCGDDELSDFGMTCTEEEPCPVYLDLVSADSAGSRLFVSGNLHAGTATLWSLLLMSGDGGQSWTEPVDRMRGSALDQVQFPDFATGFISGHTAGALPRDPFLLRTIDAGKSWTRLPVLEDGAVGLIERFQFESATRGLAQVDRGRPGAGRYATLETQNGGDTWTIKESSAVEPAAFREPIPLVRIRADASSKSFRIERREGTQWRSAAAFALAAGTCRPGIHAPPPEPPAEASPPAKPGLSGESAASGRLH